MSTDWREKYNFYPSNEPCYICGKTENTGSEPRFGYTVCEEHKDAPPVNQY